MKLVFLSYDVNENIGALIFCAKRHNYTMVRSQNTTRVLTQLCYMDGTGYNDGCEESSSRNPLFCLEIQQSYINEDDVGLRYREVGLWIKVQFSQVHPGVLFNSSIRSADNFLFLRWLLCHIPARFSSGSLDDCDGFLFPFFAYSAFQWSNCAGNGSSSSKVHPGVLFNS